MTVEKEKRTAGKKRAVEKTAPVDASDSQHEESDAVSSVAPKTRKERRKEMLKQKFEKMLTRHNARESRIAELEARRKKTGSDPEDNKKETSAAQGEGKSAAAVVDSRHHPRHFAGSFWKNRKEEKHRTLFLGNVPGSLTESDVKDLIHSSLESHLSTTEINENEETVVSNAAVTRIDFLALKAGAKARSVYVVCSSMAAAHAVVKALDGFEVQPRQFLRCNFSEDKAQRAIAISKRDAVGRGGSGRGRGGSFGRGGTPFGGGRGGRGMGFGDHGGRGRGFGDRGGRGGRGRGFAPFSRGRGAGGSGEGEHAV